MFTNIGGFQLGYNRRFNFFYKAATELKGLAIRKGHFLQLLESNWNFACQIKNKFWSHYNLKIYQPLQKKKNADLLEFNQRQDYGQVLILKSKEQDQLLRICLKQNMQDLGIFVHEKLKRQIDVNALILTIERKFLRLTHRGFKIHQKFEKLYRILLYRII